MTVELERTVPHEDVLVPYSWVRGADIDGVEAVATHPGVEAIRFRDSLDDEYLLRVEWGPEYEGILGTLGETERPLVTALGTNDQWTSEVRGDHRSDIATFRQRCRERDIPMTLTALHDPTPVETAPETALTDPQREALIPASDRGYCNSPRDVTMGEPGTELGISQQTVASRLRRGIRQILGLTLIALEE